jgi:hypothetical protein
MFDLRQSSFNQQDSGITAFTGSFAGLDGLFSGGISNQVLRRDFLGKLAIGPVKDLAVF